MIKKLDKLIIKAFIGPFVATFFITLFVLVIQFFWLYIDDFVGKGLDASVILEFIWYQSAVLVPLALPLAILLSSLMTFGNLGESFELVAIKSAGISLLRFMRPLFILSVFICGIAFLFSNYIIPVANLKSRTLLGDIIWAKPSLNLKEGVFYDKIPGYAIKIGEKVNDSLIRDVIVYEQGNSLQDNFIIAKSGIMRVTDNHRLLELNLKDGWRYQERGGGFWKEPTDYVRVGFKEFKKEFDLSAFQFNRTADSVNKNNERMYSMSQLDKAIDSLKKENKQLREKSIKDMLSPFSFIKNLDTSWVKLPPTDSFNRKKIKSFDDIIPDSAKSSIATRASGLLSNLRINSESMIYNIKEREKNLRRHQIEWHRKIALSVACLVLFLIGAPLGSIIRKGGLGTPLIFAIIFFMLFYFASTTGEKFSKEATLTPATGMWMATVVLLPIGIFLTFKAMHDSQLFNKEFYYRVSRFFKSKS